MLEAIIQNLTRQQRPYYLPQGNAIKGVGGQYWLVFQHRDLDKDGFLKNIVSLLGFKDKAVSHKVLRIDPSTAKIYTYNPRTPGDVPSPALLRTGNPKIIEKFLTLERTAKEPALLSGSFREIKGIKRRYNLPEQPEPYNKVTAQMAWIIHKASKKGRKESLKRSRIKLSSLTVPGNTLVEVTITEQTPEQITADFIISPDHPPQPITDFRVKDNAGRGGKKG